MYSRKWLETGGWQSHMLQKKVKENKFQRVLPSDMLVESHLISL